jgi:ADP-ribose pyrophosphatase YjhB (NUDIX family)
MPDSTQHAVIAVVLGVRAGRLEASLRRVERGAGETLEAALARAADVDAFAYVEQLETRLLADSTLATAYLGLLPSNAQPPTGDDIDEPELVRAARARLRAKLSYTNVGFALAPETFTISELRDIYVAALGYEVSATNLQRVLVRRGVLERVEGRRAPGRAGGRPAALFRFKSRELEITDEFAALRPRGSRASG